MALCGWVRSGNLGGMNTALRTGLRMTTALLLATGLASGNETVSDASGFRAAVAAAKPGMRILLAAGTYPGGFFFQNVRGEPNHPIVIAAADPKNPPVFRGRGRIALD